MKREEKRQQIMKAAERLFTSRRFHEVRLDEVAGSAGVGKGTIYRYFRDKDDLFFQTVAAGFDELCALLKRRVPAKAPFLEQLLGVCVQVSRFLDGRRELFRMMQTEGGRRAPARGAFRAMWTEKRKMLVGAVAEVIRSGVAEGEIREDVPPELLASFLLGMLRTRSHGGGEAPHVLSSHDVVVDVFCRGASNRE